MQIPLVPHDHMLTTRTLFSPFLIPELLHPLRLSVFGAVLTRVSFSLAVTPRLRPTFFADIIVAVDGSWAYEVGASVGAAVQGI